jgi:TIGR01210 family protein
LNKDIYRESIRRDVKEKRSPRQLEAIWKEKDMADGKIVDAMVMIMRTNGCVWAKKGGCTMCGYRSASLREVTVEDLMNQVDQAMGRYDNEPFVKIYTSGSFLDENEIPKEVRERIFKEFGKIERLLFESRPEFINEESLKDIPKNVTIALGMESMDNDILGKCINKGFTIEDTEKAGTAIKKAGLKVRSYLLLKPPYLKESDAIADAMDSVRFADRFSDEISINPINVQRATVVERLWKRGEYRPPWIWSLIKVMRDSASITNSRIMSSPSGAGSQRGVHNCGMCDQEMIERIERFSFSQNLDDLKGECECISSWSAYMETETLLGSSADMDRAMEDSLAIRR